MKNLTAKESAEQLAKLIAPFINMERMIENPDEEMLRAFKSYQSNNNAKLMQQVFNEITNK